MSNLHQTRREFKLMVLDETTINPNPLLQFEQWISEAFDTANTDPSAMVLATATTDGRPSARVVLLKHFDEQGFTFFTNYQSKKGGQLANNSFASLLFFWPELERQVRIEGRVKKENSAKSDEYYIQRPIESRISAWASPQSAVISSRKALESLYDGYKPIINANPDKRPEQWGGYCLQPELYEFWQGRENRLHDRIEFTKDANGWRFYRLAP